VVTCNLYGLWCFRVYYCLQYGPSFIAKWSFNVYNTYLKKKPIWKILAIVNTNMFIGLYIAWSMVEEIGDLIIITYPKRFVSNNGF
jgi:hypothetical protein